jgi:hypothetical protein
MGLFVPMCIVNLLMHISTGASTLILSPPTVDMLRGEFLYGQALRLKRICHSDKIFESRLA